MGKRDRIGLLMLAVQSFVVSFWLVRERERERERGRGERQKEGLREREKDIYRESLLDLLTLAVLSWVNVCVLCAWMCV